MSAKQTLLQWLAAGENDRVVEALQTIANQFGDKYFVNEVTPIAGRFNSIKRDRQKGVISDEFYNIQMNQIRQALQDLIEDVPAHATLDMQSLPPVNSGDIKPTFTDTPINPTSDQPTTAATSDIISPKVSPHIPWIVGLALLLVSAITLAGFIPCPTRAQETIFRLLMAIGAGGLATILPGLLNINIQGVKAGSAVGVLALVYLVNPAKMIEDNSRCNKIPFEFTISLQPDQALLLSPQYPTLQEATLQIRLDNKWEDALIDANGDADYKSIPGDFKDQMVATRLNAKYWKLVKDSIALTGKSQILKIVPDGTLGVIQGKVFNNDGTDFLANAVIEIAGERDTTDAQGSFNLSIPVEKQQERYELLATKTGYELQRLLAYPASGAIQIRLEKKK